MRTKAKVRMGIILSAAVGQYMHDSFHAADYAYWGTFYGPSPLSQFWRQFLWVPFAEVTQPSGFLGHVTVEILALVALTWVSVDCVIEWIRSRRVSRHPQDGRRPVRGPEASAPAKDVGP